MTDSDDKLARRYRELPREEPPAAIDETILAASRRAVASRPRSNWMVPTSIAAVLVLGIGVSLRMQMEEPGVETSVPSSSSSEYPTPAAEPPPQEEARPEAKPKPEAQPVPAPQASARAQSSAKATPDAKALARQDAAAPERARAATPAEPAAKPLAKEAEAPSRRGFAEETRKETAKVPADAPIVLQSPAPAAPPVVILPATPATTPTPPQPAAPAPALRSKREATAADNVAPSGARKLGATAEADPARELDRIARLREAGRHDEADRALAEFRRSHPDYRIPEAMWERVKPR